MDGAHVALRTQARFSEDTPMQGGGVHNALLGEVDDPPRDDLSAAVVAANTCRSAHANSNAVDIAWIASGSKALVLVK
jgi:hypothetical protein